MIQPVDYASFQRPIVGVLLGVKPIPPSEMNSYPRLKQLADANLEAKTTLAFFCSEDVDISNRTIKGTFYNFKNKKWEKKQYPYPDVVYVRGGSGKEIDDLLEEFDHWGIKRINPVHAFNKGDLYELLSRDDNVSSYLPPTEIVQTMADIDEMIRKQGKVYVKARRGRKGTKVMRIEKLNDKGYVYSYSILGDLVRRKVKSRGDLHKAIDSFFGSRPLIVQRAIDLVKFGKKRLCDFRAEVQRNKQNNIEIVGVCIRIGRKNSPITTHSSAYRYDKYLKKLFPQYSSRQIEDVKERINTFLIAVYTGVEKKYGMFGEIGIDFAVDRKGEIWLIECNAQSAKVSLEKAYGAKARRAFLNPLEYAKAITGFGRSRIAGRTGFKPRRLISGRKASKSK